MRRSEINQVLQSADEFLKAHQFYLPSFAYWTPEQWTRTGSEAAEIVENQLGWDITDFGSGDFGKYGLFLFTLRNGRPNNPTGKPYCEKIMIVEEHQVTPFHFHWLKMEDIINRGGGLLKIQLYNSTPDEELDQPDGGTLYVGEKGVLYTGTYGGKMHILPLEKMQQMAQPPRTLPRPKNIMADFLNACREGKTESAASFDYGARLTEFAFLGNLAQHAGVGKKVEWNGPNMKVTNLRGLNQWVKRPYRKGWPG